MYYQCGEYHCTEDLSQRFTEDCGRLGKALRIFPRRGVGSEPKDLYDRLVEYFPKELSFGTDALYAVEGVLRAFDGGGLNGLRAKHFYGIPMIYSPESTGSALSSFVGGLTWRTELPAKITQPPSIGARFPSWSWAYYKSLHLDAFSRLFWNTDPRTLVLDEIEVYATHKDGSTVSIADLMTTRVHETYTDYHPWIDITTWAFTIEFTRRISHHGAYARQASLRTAGSALDLDVDRDLYEDGDVWALYLGVSSQSEEASCGVPRERCYCLEFLIAQTIAADTQVLRRIGLWTIAMRKSSSDHLSIQTVMQNIVHSVETHVIDGETPDDENEWEVASWGQQKMRLI